MHRTTNTDISHLSRYRTPIFKRSFGHIRIRQKSISPKRQKTAIAAGSKLPKTRSDMPQAQYPAAAQPITRIRTGARQRPPAARSAARTGAQGSRDTGPAAQGIHGGRRESRGVIQIAAARSSTDHPLQINGPSRNFVISYIRQIAAISPFASFKTADTRNQPAKLIQPMFLAQGKLLPTGGNLSI
jgi:hypothetical protein